MSQKETSRQHYVPKTYLKRFATEKSNGEFYIKVLPKENLQEKSIYENNIINVCLENKIYTLPADSKEKRMFIETFYSDNYETYYEKIYGILTDPSKDSITAEERRLIISTVVTMFYRTTKWNNIHNKVIGEGFEKAYYLCKQTNQDFFMFEGEKISIINKTVEQLKKTYKIESKPTAAVEQLRIAFKLIRLRLLFDNIYITKLDDSDSEFITSDIPVTCTNPNGGHIIPFDPTNILSLTLDSKHQLCLIPEKDEIKKNKISRNNVSGTICSLEKMTTNNQLFHSAERFLLGTETSLKNYLRIKEISENKLSDDKMRKIKSIDELFEIGKELGLF